MSLLMVGHAELICQINRVVNATVHSHSTDGIIQVGRVTDEQQTVFPKPLGNPLMNAIDREIANLVSALLGKKSLQRALDAFGPQCVLFTLVFRHGIHDAPKTRGSLINHLEQVDPLDGIGEEIAQGQSRIGLDKVVRRHDLYKAFRISETLELNPRLLPGDTAAAVGAYHIGALEDHAFALPIDVTLSEYSHHIGSGIVNPLHCGSKVHFATMGAG